MLFALASGITLAVFLAASELAGTAPPVALLAALWLAGAAWIAAWDGVAALAWHPILSLAPPMCVWLGARLAGGADAHPLAVTFIAWAVMAACAGGMGLLRGPSRPAPPRETLRFAQGDRSGHAERSEASRETLRSAQGDRSGHAERSEASRETLRSAQSDRRAQTDRHAPGWIGLAVGLALALAGIYLAARPEAGSILALHGLRLAQEGQAEAALAQLDRSLAWGVQDSLTFDAIAQVRLLQARQATDVIARQDRLSAAADAMRAAWDASPYQAGFGRRLALIYREWAEATPNADARRERLHAARATLELAVLRAPADASLRRELVDLKKTLQDGR